MSGHSAGPWSWRALPGYIEDGDGRIVAVLATRDDEAANAMLMKAAPDLLAALESANYELAALVPNPNDTQESDWPCANEADRKCLQIAFRDIRAAIAKATTP